MCTHVRTYQQELPVAQDIAIPLIPLGASSCDIQCPPILPDGAEDNRPIMFDAAAAMLQCAPALPHTFLPCKATHCTM